ncbi:Putative acetyltransferase [Ignavibacterium album JCM 16511]|uniref:Putative acetyltransferase n=1 Tax=Ignavibacterium album (strain DSM 19864 / JCM 16511 / NBRC 101810 / Mat9-16) TaxID=945713 RepID=I0AP84_IGNAJ|nr:GNAT family N-acetyltransferase [Ignavibacterium album]AFH50791.1 Putative acetyltransferase [Ignavibacterium album JCM 16511]
MIRSIKPSDVEGLEKLLKKIPNFTEAEIKVAMELIEITVNNPEQTDYNIFVYEDDGKILGYHCTGKRPLTDAVYDLYWIVADPEHSGKGIGKNLLEHAENFVKERKGRWILAETSSKESYLSTQSFYLRNNYSIISEIKDFYSVGDNLLIFGKYFNNKNN